MPKDSVNYCAGWKSKQIQEQYTDIILPWLDIKTMSKLCVRGICKYKLKQSCGLSDEWLIEHVAPGMRECFGNAVAAILAMPLLWACLDTACASMVPESIHARVLNALQGAAERNTLPTGENCVDKVLTLVSENEGEVSFDEVPSNNSTGMVDGSTGRSDAEWRNVMFAKVASVERTGVEMQNAIASHYAETTRNLLRMDRNIKRIAVSPGVRMQNAGGGGSAREAPPAPANLCKCPKNLYVLWDEYESGSGGNKPARLFTPAERGRVKFKYSRRKIVWDVIENMCNRNVAADVAIDRIYAECGGQDTPVNSIIKRLREAKKSGGIANLHIEPTHRN